MGEKCKPYNEAQGYEYYHNVFVEKGTKIYCKDTIPGKMQRIALKYAYVHTLSVIDIKKAIKVLKKITYQNSEEYLPFEKSAFFGPEKMKTYLDKNLEKYDKIQYWIPSNSWAFDTIEKYGIVGSSDKKKKFYRCNIEIQYTIISKNGDKSVCSDCYSFYNNKENTRMYQVKCWFNPLVEILQKKLELIVDSKNVNVVPFPFSNCT